MSGGYWNFSVFLNDDPYGPKRLAKRTGSFETPGYCLSTGKKVPGDKPSKLLLKVKDILDTRIKNGVEQYLIKWGRWEGIYDTWEPLKNLKCPLLLEEFRYRRLVASRPNYDIDKDELNKQHETVRAAWLQKFGLSASEPKASQIQSEGNATILHKEQENIEQITSVNDQPASKLQKIEINEASESQQVDQPNFEPVSSSKPDKTPQKRQFKRKRKERPPCKECGMEMSSLTRQQIYLHKMKHNSLSCPFCSKKYATNRNLDMHVRISHAAV